MLISREKPAEFLTADKVSTENIRGEYSALRTGAISVIESFDGRKSRKSTLLFKDSSESPLKKISEQENADQKQT